ncbi:hypothetical protein GCM10027062_08300 [Nocardioides hungaricus]
MLAAALLLAGCTGSAPAGDPADEVPSPRPAADRRWDPRDVAELPAAGREVLPGLPDEVTPPDRAPSLATRPMAAAVLGVQRLDDRILLLGGDGSWREVWPGEQDARGSLSPDGTRLAILLSDRIELWSLPTGQRTELDLPARLRPWDFARIAWIDDAALLLDDRAGGWRIDIASGRAERTPYPRDLSWTVAADGTLLETTDPRRRPAVVDWSDGTARRVDLAEVGTPLQVRASADVVAGTAYGDGDVIAFAFDRDAPEAIRTLRMRDFDANYSNWALRVAHVLDDGSVLLWIAIPGRRSEDDGWRLVRWDPATDALATVTSSDANPTWDLMVARAACCDAAPLRGATSGTLVAWTSTPPTRTGSPGWRPARCRCGSPTRRRTRAPSSSRPGCATRRASRSRCSPSCA